MKLVWDKAGERFYETGVDRGVLYPSVGADYPKGVAWNGLTTVTESPSGAEASPQYADNIKYLNLISTEEFGGTIEAFFYPKEFEKLDGTAELTPGILIGQQNRGTFGLSYRTKLGNDTEGQDHGYKLHIIYGALAAPSEKAYATVNDSPEAITFSWELTTTPVDVPGFKPTATLTISSLDVPADRLADLEDVLYGTSGQDPRLPLPAEIAAIFEGSVVEVTATMPGYNSTTHVITIPTIAGVTYMIDGEPVTGTVTITEDTVVNAVANDGYKFTDFSDDDWSYDFV